MADQRADQEIGAVLIAVNSYRNDPKLRLPYTDGVLKGYIETFYQYLFFQVDVLLDFSLKQFNDALKKFIIRCQKDKMTRIAVVLYGHGGIVNEKECILTNNSEFLPIATLEKALHSHFPEDNKYLFIDACRNSAQPCSSYVFQTTTIRTTIVRSTLVFEKAICNVWSNSFAKHLRNQCVLSDVVKNVDLDMHRHGIDQNSEIKEKGAADSPDFQGEARACNGHNKMCFRQPNAELQTFIEETEKSFAAMRTNSTHPDPPPVKTLPSSTSSTKTMAGKTATSTAHEMLKETCWMPFGLQTHEVFPSDSTVVLYLVPGTENYLEKTIRLEVPGGAVKGPSLEVHTAVIACGPMLLPDSLQLASMVVYVDFKAENVSNSLILHLPDWKRKDGTTTSRCTVIRAEHDYDDSLEGYQFKVMASSSGKQPENDSISLDGHCSLFGKALREGEISSYFLAVYQPKSKEENRTKVQVVVTFKSVTWIKIFEKYNQMQCMMSNRIVQQLTNFEFRKVPKDPFLEVSFKENDSRELGWRAAINASNKIYEKDVNYQEFLIMSRETFSFVRSSHQRKSLRDAVETGVYPPVISCEISLYMDLHCEQQSMYVPLTVSGNIKREQTFEFLCTIPNQRKMANWDALELKAVDSKAFAKKGSSQEGSREVPVKAESSGQAQQKLPSKPDVTFLDSPPNSPSNQPAQKIGLSSVQANQAPHNPPFVASQLSSPTDTDPSNQPAQVPIPQGTQPSSTSSTQAMAGVTSTSTTGLDAVISSVDEIMKLKDGMQAQQLFLGTVLGLTSDTTNAILCAPNACSFITTLTIILQTWMTLNPGATWRDLVTALEKNEIYNTVIYNIKKKFAK